MKDELEKANNLIAVNLDLLKSRYQLIHRCDETLIKKAEQAFSDLNPFTNKNLS